MPGPHCRFRKNGGKRKQRQPRKRKPGSTPAKRVIVERGHDKTLNIPQRLRNEDVHPKLKQQLLFDIAMFPRDKNGKRKRHFASFLRLRYRFHSISIGYIHKMARIADGQAKKEADAMQEYMDILSKTDQHEKDQVTVACSVAAQVKQGNAMIDDTNLPGHQPPSGSGLIDLSDQPSHTLPATASSAPQLLPVGVASLQRKGDELEGLDGYAPIQFTSNRFGRAATNLKFTDKVKAALKKANADTEGLLSYANLAVAVGKELGQRKEEYFAPKTIWRWCRQLGMYFMRLWVRPKILPNHRLDRVDWVLQSIVGRRGSYKFEDFKNVVHLDEKCTSSISGAEYLRNNC